MTVPTSLQPSLFADASRPKGPSRLGGTSVEYEPVKEILTRATGFMEDYDFTLNPYSGCAFGCTYCYAAFFARSSARRDSWGDWVRVKENAVSRLGSRRSSLDGKRIYMSSVTDPYQPIERKLRLTRGLLKVLARMHRPKLVIQTRSPDVLRDVDLLRELVDNGGRVQVNMTVTTDDEDIRRVFEPACPSNERRLRAARDLAERGVAVCVTLTPLLLLRNAERFSSALLESGIQRYIVQPFHFKRGRFVAGTRESAQALMAEKLRSDPKDFGNDYMAHYRSTRRVLRERLPQLAEGKEGFKPPF